MALFKNMAITYKGMALYAKAQAGQEIRFTKMQVGSGQIGTQNPATLIGLIDPKLDVNITSINPKPELKSATIVGNVTNKDLLDSLYICEIGLWVTDPDEGEILYGYASCGTYGDYYAPEIQGPYSWQYEINVAIGNAANVTAQLSVSNMDYSLTNSNTTFVKIIGGNQKEINKSIDTLINDLDLKLKNHDEQLGEMENKKVSYTDLTPVNTTGTESAYIATIPANITEVTIVPHINNLQGATLNGIAILDREGKPIEKDTLKMNIPTKFVRVGSNFFIASSGGKDKYVAYGKEVATNIYATKDRGCAIDNDGNIYVQGAHYSGWFVEKINPQGEVIWSTEVVASTGSNTYGPINFICDGYLYSFDLTKARKVVKLTLEGEIVAEYPGLWDLNFYQYKINYEEKTIYTTRSKCNFETGITTQYPSFLDGGTTIFVADPSQYSNNDYNILKLNFGASSGTEVRILNNNLEVVGSINSGVSASFVDVTLLKDCIAVVMLRGSTREYVTYSLEDYKSIVTVAGPVAFSVITRLKGEVYIKAATNTSAHLLTKNSMLTIPLELYDYVTVTNNDYILRNGSAMWKVKYEKISKII